MRIFRDSKALAEKVEGPVLTLGNFDGLHLGHRKIITRLVERARSLSLPSVVYTFEPHPLKVVAPHKSPPLIVDIATKMELIGALGVDFAVVAEFTKEFAAKHPRAFVEDEIAPLRPREVWVGHDFSFGKAKSGTVDYLGLLGAELGFEVCVVPAYTLGGEVVSSSRVRRLVAGGKLAEARRLLGRDFSIKGKVVRGRDIGKALGFPTANVAPSGELVPGEGVYAAFASVAGERYAAVVNIGRAPTFADNRDRCVEAHILGFSGDLYGQEIELEFVRRLRGERAFRTKEALVRQITKDASRAEAILAARGKGG